jgi:hypothetical protein
MRRVVVTAAIRGRVFPRGRFITVPIVPALTEGRTGVVTLPHRLGYVRGGLGWYVIGFDRLFARLHEVRGEGSLLGTVDRAVLTESLKLRLKLLNRRGAVRHHVLPDRRIAWATPVRLAGDGHGVVPG